MDNNQAIMVLRGLADVLEYFENQKALTEGKVRAVEKHFDREFRRIEQLEDDYTRKCILQENVNKRLDRERELAEEKRLAAAASTSTRKKRQRKKSLLRRVKVWIRRKRYKLRKLTRRRRGHAMRTRGSVPAVR